MGSQDLYEHSPAYLKHSGVYVNVGNIGISTALTLWRWLKNSTQPRWLGGVPRKFIQFSTIPTKERGEKLAALATENGLTILIDSTFKMEDALLVSRILSDVRAINY